jgi:hypothetical protein
MSDKPEALKFHGTNFVLVMLFILAIGLVITLAAPQLFSPEAATSDHSIWETILHEVGHAMIVAAILGLTVDTFAKKRHEMMAEHVTKKINTDVIGAIYGQQFPASIRAEVRKSFLEQRIHREDLNITYTFTALPGYPDRLLVKEQSSFKFVNSSDQAVSIPLRAFVETPIEQELREFCKIDSASIDGEDLGEEDLKGKFFENGMELRWEYPITIPAHGTMNVSSACQTIKYTRDVENWSSLYPSDGIVLNISLDVELAVFAKCVNSGTLKKEIDQKHFKRWKLDNGVFPGQAITFWWSPPQKHDL